MCCLYFETVNCNYSSILDIQVFIQKKIESVAPVKRFNYSVFVLKSLFFVVTGRMVL